MNNYRIIFIIPWIGKLPSYFPIWLESCSKNPTVDFLIFTDDHTKYKYPNNVIVHYVSFEELKSLFQAKFDFSIALSKPYKFCDFKPTYGEVFHDYINAYDFWGHCDIDLIWGDIRKFITDDILKQYKKIYSHGHCCLYKNTPEVNAWYRTLPCNGYQYYRNVFQSEKSCCFDEIGLHCGGGMTCIVESNGIDVYKNIDFADINVKKGYFYIRSKPKFHSYKKLYFRYDNGNLYACNNGSIIEELLYVHFQKRNIHIDEPIGKIIYLIAPNIITSDYDKTKKNYFFAEKKHELNYQYMKIIRKVSGILMNYLSK